MASAVSSKGVAVVLGVGPGTGAAISRAFAKKGFTVAMLARTQSNLDVIADSINKEGGTAKGFACDISKESSILSAFQEIKSSFTHQPVKVGVYNASAFTVKPFLEQTLTDLDNTMLIIILIVQTFVSGAFVFSQQVIRLMQEHNDGGSLLFTGATAAVRGSAHFSTFAAQKFAIRGLTQSLAREFNPTGIHVAHVIIDGLIDTEKVRSTPWGSNQAADARLSPEGIADAFVYLHEQPRSVWTLEMDLRPFGERF
ncbi:hypothetical protein HDU67_010074 [Dinochytrium kinnereticum]|nr:hypothetical protein HDU67_010074 [Dinochytrium kinnereticum]